MYYAGQLERRYDLRFRVAVAMENTDACHMASGAMWAGAGARLQLEGRVRLRHQVPERPATASTQIYLGCLAPRMAAVC